ncbi:MAG TPA: hypothetical protein VFO05_15210 [Candidatus Limnocylindrales bacterium]|nr:hypothetical protein [Candidatus Limnocylindrales bacterium]
MKNRLQQILRIVAAFAIPILIAVAAGAVTVYLTGPGGLVSCVGSVTSNPDGLQRWVIVAGVPAMIAGLAGAFFALAGGRVLTRLIGLGLALALAGVTFYQVYLLLPADCRPA